MKITAVIAAILAFSGNSFAAAIETPGTTSVYLCNDRDFTGYCVDIKSPSGVCVPLGDDLNDQLSSVGPDQGSFCYFYV
jgi:hypothetical protein